MLDMCASILRRAVDDANDPFGALGSFPDRCHAEGDGLARSGRDTSGKELGTERSSASLTARTERYKIFVHLATMLHTRLVKKSPRPAFHSRAYRREEKKRERRELARHGLEMKS